MVIKVLSTVIKLPTEILRDVRRMIRKSKVYYKIKLQVDKNQNKFCFFFWNLIYKLEIRSKIHS